MDEGGAPSIDGAGSGMISRTQLAGLIVGITLAACGVRAQPAPSGYSAAGLYNLANAYARDGKPGMAVLNYERAGLLAPNDADITANLRYVQLTSRLPPESRNAFERTVRVANPLLLSWVGVFGFLIVAVSVLATQLFPQLRWLRRTALFLGLVLVGLTVCNGVVLWPKLHEGVVITAATPVRVSPVPMGDPLFVLPEAETVRMVAEHEGFVLIRTRAGRTGWAARANIAPVVPRE
jgi:hypothetical protein